MQTELFKKEVVTQFPALEMALVVLPVNGKLIDLVT